MKKYTVYVASAAEDGGIYKYELSEEGKLTELASIPLQKPYYFVKRGEILHTILRSPDGFSGNGGYLAVSADLTSAGEIHTTGGVGACHLEVTDEGIYATNYFSGSVTRIDVRTLVHEKTEHNHPGRQDTPHAHFVKQTPDGKYLAVCDLGLDKIIVYDKELNYVSDVSVPDGAGVRHLVFSNDGKYAYTANELDSTTSVLAYGEGKFTLLNTVAVDSAVENYPGAIRLSPEGDKLYVSQRGLDGISVFDVDGGSISQSGFTSCHGCWPRDFALSPDGRFIVCTNERGNNVTVLDTQNSYKLTDNLPLATPLCALVI